MVGWNKRPQTVLHQPQIALLLPFTEPLQHCTKIPDTEAPCEDRQGKEDLGLVSKYIPDFPKSKIKGLRHLNSPACPTTCSHCWGFLGVIGTRDKRPENVWIFHAEFNQLFFSTHFLGHSVLPVSFFRLESLYVTSL